LYIPSILLPFLKTCLKKIMRSDYSLVNSDRLAAWDNSAPTKTIVYKFNIDFTNYSLLQTKVKFY